MNQHQQQFSGSGTTSDIQNSTTAATSQPAHFSTANTDHPSLGARFPRLSLVLNSLFSPMMLFRSLSSYIVLSSITIYPSVYAPVLPPPPPLFPPSALQPSLLLLTSSPSSSSTFDHSPPPQQPADFKPVAQMQVTVLPPINHHQPRRPA